MTEAEVLRKWNRTWEDSSQVRHYLDYDAGFAMLHYKRGMVIRLPLIDKVVTSIVYEHELPYSEEWEKRWETHLKVMLAKEAVKQYQMFIDANTPKNG